MSALFGLRFSSPAAFVARARRIAPPPGEGRWMLKNIPEAMLRICPGYRTYEPVAPVSVARPVNDR